MNSFVLKGNILLSKTKEQLEDHPNSYLVCEEGVSAGVYYQLPEAYKNLPLADYRDSLIVPGLVDLHIHVPQLPIEAWEWIWS